MNIPIPCALGDSVITRNGLRTLQGVTWFKWFDGMEFTYFYESTSKWNAGDFEVARRPAYDYKCFISDILLKDDSLKDRGYPLKGKGYAYGYKFVDGDLYVELILSDRYLAHVYVQCNECGDYLENGKVLVPPTWDTEEKQKSILLARYRDISVSCYRV